MRDYRRVIRVLIFDHQPVVRFGLRHLLDEDSELTVVGETGDIEELARLVEVVQPDVLLGDPGEDLDDLETLRGICARLRNCSIIVYTTRAGRAHTIMNALESGVGGYLLKESDLDGLLHDIRIVCQGTTVLAPTVASKLLEHLKQQDAPQEKQAAHSLSDREQEVLEFLAQGMSNHSIAESLHICEATVKFHVHSILGKLHAGNRTEAVMKAVQRGFIHLGLLVAQIADFVGDDFMV